MSESSTLGLHAEIKQFQREWLNGNYVKLSSHIMSRILVTLNERWNYEGASQRTEVQPKAHSSRIEKLIIIHGSIAQRLATSLLTSAIQRTHVSAPLHKDLKNRQILRNKTDAEIRPGDIADIVLSQ